MAHRGVGLLALCGLLSGCLWERESADLTGQDIRLTVLHTSDIHSRLVPYDIAPTKTDRDLGLIPQAAPFGGAARLAALLKRERARSERVIHVDSGDCFQGAPIFNQSTGEAEIRFMSLMKPDAVVIGNHEFDAGALTFARQAETYANYPLLAANYDFTRPNIEDPTDGALARVTRPYEIINSDGLRIGIVGMGNLGSLNSIVEGGNSLGVTPLEQNETVRGYVEFLHNQVDLIMVISHLGLEEDQWLVQGYTATYERDRIESFLTRKHQPWEIVKDFGDGRVEVKIPGVRGIDVIMGGHLHVVLNPPQVLTDLDGRQVVLSHGGAFAKYLGRLDLVVSQPKDEETRRKYGYEVKAHTYHAFPIDSLWCMERDERENLPTFSSDDAIKDMLEDNKRRCAIEEDPATHRLLDFYELQMGLKFDLPMIVGFAPRNIDRRNSTGGGDSPLGNLVVDAMRRRQRVEAEFSSTNTLGIRDNLYAGPITLESMFNVFPFENTITLMYLSGVEVQELFDFMAERSAGRGCQSQAQVGGAKFIMDCGVAIDNEYRAADPSPEARCSSDDQCRDRALLAKSPESELSEWSCRQSSCYRHPAREIVINGEPINPNASYKVAVNDYIAKGGSGFEVLKRNTTRIDTGISLRDALIDSLRNRCSCEELEKYGPASERCAVMFGGLATEPHDDVADERCADVGLPTSCSSALGWCAEARKFHDELEKLPPGANESDYKRLGTKAYVSAGKCGCHDLLAHDTQACGHITDALENFCLNPLSVPVIATEADGRIVRRVK